MEVTDWYDHPREAAKITGDALSYFHPGSIEPVAADRSIKLINLAVTPVSIGIPKSGFRRNCLHNREISYDEREAT